MKFWKEKEPDWRMSSPVFSKHCPVSTSSLCRAASVIIKRTWNKAGARWAVLGTGLPPAGPGRPFERFRFLTNKNPSLPSLHTAPGCWTEPAPAITSCPRMPFSKSGYNWDSSSSWLYPLGFRVFSKQPPQLAIVCCTVVPAGSVRSVRHDISQGRSPSCCLRNQRAPRKAPRQPLPPRTPFLPSQTPDTQLQKQSPLASGRCLTLNLNIDKRPPWLGIF